MIMPACVKTLSLCHAIRFRDAQFCECSAALMQKYIRLGLYMLTDVRSHALIVIL